MVGSPGIETPPNPSTRRCSVERREATLDLVEFQIARRSIKLPHQSLGDSSSFATPRRCHDGIDKILLQHLAEPRAHSGDVTRRGVVHGAQWAEDTGSGVFGPVS